LVFDSFPESRLEAMIVSAKIFIKEGLLLGDWDGVGRARRGHGSVKIPEALLSTLRDNGVYFSLNDFAISGAGAHAVVLKDVRCLRWAIQQKRLGLIKRLIAGPFICTLPSECDEILLSPEIDGLLFLSDWHRNLFLSLARKRVPASYIWFSGVDTDWWTPVETPKSQVLVYRKRVTDEIFNHVLNITRRSGLEPCVLEYGFYTQEQFRSELRKSKFAVFLSQSETQGLAMFEAWSCNVPTLHRDPGLMSFLGKNFPGASSCPYLSPDLGLRFTDLTDVEEHFCRMLSLYPDLKPRDHVMARYTNEHSAVRFMSILTEVIGFTEGTLSGGENGKELSS